MPRAKKRNDIDVLRAAAQVYNHSDEDKRIIYAAWKADPDKVMASLLADPQIQVHLRQHLVHTKEDISEPVRDTP